MKFTVSPASFADAVNSVLRFVPDKSAIPVLENLLLSPVEGDAAKMTLSANDGDSSVCITFDVDESQDLCPFLVPARSLSDLIKTMGQFPITFETNKDEVIISDFFGDFHLMGSTDVSAFPLPKEVDVKMNVEIAADKFIDVASVAKNFASEDALRPIMSGVYFEFNAAESSMAVTSSDSKMLFFDLVREVTASEDFGMVINSAILNKILSVLANGADENIHIVTDGSRLCISRDGTTVVAKLQEGKYPRVQSVIPKNNNSVVNISRVVFLSAIERASKAADASTRQLRLTFDGDSSLVIESRDINYSISSKVRISTNEQNNINGKLEIGIRSNYLTDVLKKAFKISGNVLLKMSDATRAVLIYDENESERTVLVMPMQLTNF